MPSREVRPDPKPNLTLTLTRARCVLHATCTHPSRKGTGLVGGRSGTLLAYLYPLLTLTRTLPWPEPYPKKLYQAACWHTRQGTR